MPRLSALALLALLLGTVTTAAGREKSDKGKLTDQNLKSFLDDMGYGPKEAYKGYCHFEVFRNDYRVSIGVLLSGDGRWVYLMVRGNKIQRPAEMPARFWKRLLVQNEGTAVPGTYWSYSKADRYVKLMHYMPNSEIAPAKFRKQVNAFHDLVKQNGEIWASKEPDLVPIEDGPADAKERAKIQGRWEAVEAINAGVKMTEEQLKKDTKGKKLEFVFEKKIGSLQIGVGQNFESRMGPEAGQMSLYLGDTKYLLPIRYQIDKDTLIVCMDPHGVGFPTTIESTRTNGYAVFKLKRVEKGAGD